MKKRILLAAFSIVCISIVTIMLLTKESAYQPKYNTIGHKVLAIEELFGDKPDYKILDRLIDSAKEKIPVQDNYTHFEAISVLNSIGDVLIENNIVYKQTTHFSQVFKAQKLDKSIVKQINNPLSSIEYPDSIINDMTTKHLFHVKEHPDEKYYFADCDTCSLIYLSIADAMNLPIKAVRIPGHVFVRWYFDDNVYINWETNYSTASTDAGYIRRYEISDNAIEKGVYMKPLSYDNILAMYRFFKAVKREKRKDYIEHINEVIDQYPEFASAYQQRYYYYEQKKDYEKALSDISKTIELMPGNHKDYIRRAYTNLRSENYEEALKDLSEDKSFCEKCEEKADYYRASSYIALRKYDEAMDALDDIAKLDTDSYRFHCMKAKVLLRTGEKEKALEESDIAIQQETFKSYPRFVKGVIQINMGNYDGALESFNKSIMYDRKYAWAYCYRAQVWCYKGKFAKAKRDIKEALALNADRSAFYTVSAIINLAEGDIDEGLANSNEAVKKVKNPITGYEAFYTKGLIHEMRNEKQEAEDCFELAKNMDPFDKQEVDNLLIAKGIKTKDF